MEAGVAQRLSNLEPKVLITGHTGFKGTWMTLLLESLNFEVFGYSLKPQQDSLFEIAKRNGKIDEKFADIRDLKSFQRYLKTIKPNVIFHLAAQPLVLESYANPILTFDTNVMGTANVLEAAASCDSVKLVVVVTSDKVYKNDSTKIQFSESDSLRGSDPYSASKVAAEAVIDAWRKIQLIRSNPLKIISVRSGNVIGGGDSSADRLLPDLIKSFLSGNNLLIRNPQNTRPWQHVLDPIFGYLLAANASLDDQKFTACNFGPLERSLSVEEVVRIACKRWGSTTNISFGSEKNILESEFLGLDSSFANKELGWAPKWDQVDAVTSTVDWWSAVANGRVTAELACQRDIGRLLSP